MCIDCIHVFDTSFLLVNWNDITQLYSDILQKQDEYEQWYPCVIL